jgi:hypothetical protein
MVIIRLTMPTMRNIKKTPRSAHRALPLFHKVFTENLSFLGSNLGIVSIV